MKHLLLFDMDGTLLINNEEAKKPNPKRKIFPAVLDEVFHVGYPRYDKILTIEKIAGMTDVMIIRYVLETLGVGRERIEAGLPIAVKRICEMAGEMADQATEFDTYVPLPGVVEMLEGFKAGGYTMSVCTGNLDCMAKMKLEIIGLHNGFFGPGGFGSDAEDRSEIIAAAIARNAGFEPESTLYFGDTPRDIAAARQAGVVPVGVTVSGHFSARDLDGAAAIVENWEALDAVMALLQ